MEKSSLFIQYALISVFDKSNILEFSQSLIKNKIQLLSTEGTAQILLHHNLPTLKISDYINFPEIMNGRLKTLHYKIYAGILKRKKIDDVIMKKHNIKSIDMLIVNFYPFQKFINHEKYTEEEMLNNIDIGGPSIVRAAIKNYKNTVIIIDHNDYQKIIEEINISNGYISIHTRHTLAIKALKYIIEYDKFIYHYFNKKLNIDNTLLIQNNTHIKSYNNFPNTLNLVNLAFKKKKNVIYGENPHQKAALYIQDNTKNSGSVITAQQLQGKKLSYNNIVDMDTALECVKTFAEPTCVIVKHANPCGVASSHNIYIAYNQAYHSDSMSAFGGIIAFNRTLDTKTALSIIDNKFTEAVIAPNIDPDCLPILSRKKNIKILICGSWSVQNTPQINLKSISNGLLVQECDNLKHLKNYQIVTIHKPTDKEIQDALFCWKIVKFVKSNAIVCGKNNQTTGIGSGQMNRVYAVKIATTAFNTQKKLNIQGSVMASDAFFTFSDGIKIAAEMGIRCIIQPGGSIKDQEIIDTANQQKISMIFTYIRHFRH